MTDLIPQRHFFGLRKRNPLEQTTIDTRQYALDKWHYPHLGEIYLAEISSATLKRFVDVLAAAGLSPATIRDYVNIAKWVVASAINENGDEMFPRKWNDELIDAPQIENQRQPSVNSENIDAILNTATDRYQLLYALLIGSALGLELDTEQAWGTTRQSDRGRWMAVQRKHGLPATNERAVNNRLSAKGSSFKRSSPNANSFGVGCSAEVDGLREFGWIEEIGESFQWSIVWPMRPLVRSRTSRLIGQDVGQGCR